MTNNNKLLELLNACRMEELKKALIENIREENTKKAGTNSTIASIIKRALKENSGFNGERFNKTQVSKQGYNCLIAGGHYLLIDKEKNIFNLPIAEDAERFTAVDNMAALPLEYTEKIAVSEIDLIEVKAFAKEHKSKNLKPYVIKYNNHVIGVNAQFLADCIEFSKCDYMYFAPIKSGCLRSPIFFDGETAAALVCPVNVMDPEKGLAYMENWRNLSIYNKAV